MRNLAFSVVFTAAIAAGFLGCGGGSTRRPDAGSAGATGSAGSSAGASGTAGAGTAGVSGTAGAGTAGDTGTAGAGTAGAGTAGAGTAGAGTAGAPPPPPTYCDTHPQKALPYTVATDYTVVHVLSNNNSAGYWKVVASPDCNATTFPPFPSPSDGGADGGADAGDASTSPDVATEGGATDGGTDAAEETLTLSLDDPDAGDGGVVDAAPDAAVDGPQDVPADFPSSEAGEAGTDAVATEGGTDAGPALPGCWEFSYDPDGCVGACWAGVVYQIEDVQGPTNHGICIKPGAMSIEFYARASKDNARVKFGAVGEGVGSREQWLNITTAWTKYTIPINGADQQTYNELSLSMDGNWNGFSVVVEQQDHVGGTYILVKDMRWLATAPP